MKILKMSIFLMMAVIVTAGAVLAAPARIASITDHIDGPMRVAADSQGNLYVTEPAKKRVVIFDNTHQYLRSLSVPYPVGIAVDPAGKIYVGSGASDRKSGNKNAIYIYNADLTLSGTLGIGEGEVAYPNDIAIGSDGIIYVVDTGNHRINVYDPATGAQFSFGGLGSASGQFKRPVCVAVSDTAGEIYVADSPVVSTANGPTDGARIQVFNKNGQFLRSFGQFGTGIGQITSPSGIAVDSAGMLYVTDSYQNVVHILNPSNGSPAGSGGLYDPAKPLYNPIGVAAGRNGLVYVVSFRGEGNKGRIDVYALDGYVTMAVDPLSLTFVGTQYAGNPDPQTIVIANTGSGTLNWSATADQAWINLGKQDPVGPKSAGGLAVGVNIPAFGVGTYAGTITIDSGFGRKQAVGVTLSVVQPPILNVSNGWLNFASKKGTTPAAQGITLGVDNLTGPVAWSVTSDSPAWLAVSPASGTISSTAPSAAATVSVNTTGLKVGSYSGLLTVHAPGAIGTGGKLTVNLTIAPSSKISVSTNRAEAKFTVSGPATYTGSAAAWSVEDAPAGDYTVAFEALSGYRKPRPQSKSLAENSEMVFTGDYVSWKDIAAKKNIVVARGPGVKNNAQVKAFKNTGAAAAFDLVALETGYGANVAVGDIDGDGIAELIVGAGDGQNNPSTVRIYRADRTMMLEFTPFAGLGGVKVAAGDIDGDGASEVIVMRGGDDDTRRSLKVFVYRSAENRMVDTGVNMALSSEEEGGINIAAADTDGDRKSEIITTTSAGDKSMAVAIWKVNAAKGVGEWTAAQVTRIPVSGKHGLSVAGGDFDGDGTDELVVGVRSARGNNADVVILKADGAEQKRFSIASQEHGITVSAADLDGDGVAEILAGVEVTQKAGKNNKNSKGDDDRDDDSGRTSEVRVFGADGTLKYAITPFENAKDGINLAVGDLGL